MSNKDTTSTRFKRIHKYKFYKKFSSHLGTIKIFKESWFYLLLKFKNLNFTQQNLAHLIVLLSMLLQKIYGLALCKISWFLELSRWYFVNSKVAHMKNPKKIVKTTVTSTSNHSGSKVAWFWWVGGGHTSGFVVGGGKLDFRES